MLEHYLTQSLFVVALLTAIPLLIVGGAGLVVAAFQTATQIQEQSLPFLVKLLVFLLVLVVLGDTFAQQVVDLCLEVFKALPQLGRM